MELGHARELVIGLAAKDLDRHALADQRALDEDCLAVDPGDAAAFLVERGDDDGVHPEASALYRLAKRLPVGEVAPR